MTKKIAIILAVYLGILGLLEGVGQITIGWIEARRPSGTFAEEILSHEEPVLGFGLRKSITRKIAHWSVTTNNYGFRDLRDLPAAKPAGEYRIFIVGGSTVFGWGVDGPDSIPAQIQNLVDEEIKSHSGRNAFPGTIRVINAGVPWYASWHEAALVFFRIFELNPDRIIVMDGLNDTAFAMAPHWSPIVDGFIDNPTRLAYEQRKEGEKFSSPFMKLLKLSPTFRYVYAKLKDREQLSEGAPHPLAWNQYAGYWERIATLANLKSVNFSLFFQPVMVIDKPLVYTEVITDGTSMKSPAFADKFRGLYLTGESVLSHNRKLPFISLKSAFANEHQIMYLDGLHYSAAGNKILARLIFENQIAPWISSRSNTVGVR